jgi:hypothetical protein
VQPFVRTGGKNEMRLRFNIWLVLFVVVVALIVGMSVFYKHIIIPTPDNDHWLSVGKITELQMSNNEVDHIKFEGSIRFEGSAIDKNLEAPKGFVVTNDTLVYKSISEGKRVIATINDLMDGQEVEVWTHFLSDHLIGAFEITILY